MSPSRKDVRSQLASYVAGYGVVEHACLSCLEFNLYAICHLEPKSLNSEVTLLHFTTASCSQPVKLLDSDGYWV